MIRRDSDEQEWLAEVENKGAIVLTTLAHVGETERSGKLARLFKELHTLAVRAKRDSDEHAVALAHWYQVMCLEGLPEAAIPSAVHGLESAKSSPKRPSELLAKIAEHSSIAAYIAKRQAEHQLLHDSYVSADIFHLVGNL